MEPVLVARGHGIVVAKIDSDGRSWVEVIPTAEKARNGPWYFTTTRADLDTYAESLRSRPGAVPVDRDHEGDAGKSTRAAGWFTGEARVIETGQETPNGDAADHDALWAEVQWTPRAVQEIRDGEFRFMSPVWSYRERDSKTGLWTKAKEIIAATLTNRPYFTQMAAVTARDLFDSAELDELDTLFGAETSALVMSALGGDIEAIRAAATKARSTSTEGDDMSDLTAIATELGLGEDADQEKILEAVKAIKTKAESGDEGDGDGDGDGARVPKGSVVLASDQVAELQAKAAAGERAEKRLAELEVDRMLDDAVRAGKVYPVQRESLKAWGLQDAEALSKHLEATPEHSLKLKAAGSGEDRDEREVDPEIAKGFRSSYGTVDDESLTVHAKALEILGKEDYSEDEYLRATARAEREIKAAAA